MSRISIQSSAPPPPPPPPETDVWLPAAAVTFSIAEAGATLLPAGPVTRAFAGIPAEKLPSVALVTPKEIVHVPLAGILAPDSVTLLEVVVNDNAAPPQVLVGV